MPLVDLPLDELNAYQGRNPKPADFDAYWDSAIFELDGIDADLKLVQVESPARFAEAFDMTWTGVGGARLYAKLVRPRKQSGHGPGLVRFHGYSMNAGDWFEALPYAANGFTVASIDVRGQGGRSEDTGGVLGTTLNGHIVRGLHDSPEKLLYRSIFLDCAQLARLVMEMPNVDGSRVGATGWSQGGGLTLACAALEPRVARAAPAYPFLCDYRRVWEMDLARSAYDEIQTYFRRFDPRHEREHEVFERLGYIDVQHLAPRIQARVLMATGLMDSVCPPSTQFAAFNRIRSQKEMLLYPDFGHEGLPHANDDFFRFLSEMIDP